ncbi:MAG: 16S rRNA (guanine966-N2)-methyltransferase [Pelagibacterales bacterium]|nr:16S rRNA (guanine966-N2)-methyltransferase [Pelagibacterales bacterium]
MRIIAGKLKGSTLHISNNKITRPLKDVARESIFNLLVHSNKILLELENSIILDLYAGTGSFGLECISRGSSSVYFVENDKSAFEILEKNIKKLKIKKKTKTYLNEVLDLICIKNILLPKFDLIFCDPPFKSTNIDELVDLIFQKNLLKKNGIIILHRNKIVKDKFPNYFKVLDERTYGVSKIIFGKMLL